MYHFHTSSEVTSRIGIDFKHLGQMKISDHVVSTILDKCRFQKSMMGLDFRPFGLSYKKCQNNGILAI